MASGEKPVDPKLERLMKQLGEAINDSVSGSEQIAKVVSQIKSSGFDVFVVLEATVGFNKREESEPLFDTPLQQNQPELSISSQDVQFLKSLRISLEPKSGRNSEKAA
jgi:hypothetical protein